MKYKIKVTDLLEFIDDEKNKEINFSSGSGDFGTKKLNFICYMPTIYKVYKNGICILRTTSSNDAVEAYNNI